MTKGRAKNRREQEAWEGEFLLSNSYRDCLAKIFKERSLKNSSYSLRAFARDLDLAPSTLSALLRLQKHLSFKKAHAMSQKLKLSSHLQDYFLLLVVAENSKTSAEIKAAWDAVRSHRKRYIYSHFPIEDQQNFTWTWLHVSLMLLARIARFPDILEHLRPALPATDAQVQQAIDDLMRRGWLVPGTNGMEAPFGHLYAPHPGPEVRALHRHMHEQKLLALETLPIEMRTFSQYFLTLRSSDYEAFAAELGELMRKNCDRVESRQYHDAVYSLSWQLVPLFTPKQ